MAVSQILVRRHRNRDGNEDAPPASSSTNGNMNNTGIDEEAPTTQNIYVGTSSARREAGSNANDDTNPPVTAGNAPSVELTNEEHELVVQVPDSWQQSSGGTPPSFVPQTAWEPSEEAMALRREAIRLEVR